MRGHKKVDNIKVKRRRAGRTEEEKKQQLENRAVPCGLFFTTKAVLLDVGKLGTLLRTLTSTR